MKFTYPEGATPVDADEVAALIPPHITLQRELNEWEEANILEAVTWANTSRQSDLLSPAYLNELHKRMFNHTWKWAGTYRQSDKNIGGSWYRIREDIHNLCEDTKLWINDRTYPPDEITLRFHHRLVLIHSYPNGNGRHARIMADLLITSQGGTFFSWGQANLAEEGQARRLYINALQAADHGNIKPLLVFARS